MQARELPPLALVGARVRPRPRNVCQTLLLFEFRSALSARGGLPIVNERLGSRPAPHRQAENFEFRDDSLQRQTQMIAHSNTMRGLDAFRIQTHLAAIDCRGRETASLEEPGVP